MDKLKKPYSLSEMAAAKEKMIGVKPTTAMPAEEIAPKKKFDWAGAIGRGLQGASAAIQANVGPTEPGQEFSQGLQRGIIGAGTVSAGVAAQRAAAESRKQRLSESLDLLMAKENMKPKEPSWEEKFRLTEEGKNKRQQAGVSYALDKATKMADLAKKSGKSDSDLQQLRQDAYKQAFQEALKADVNLEDPNSNPIIENRANQLYELWLNPNAAKIKITR